ncbi:MAG: hypothetical protein IGS23_22265 [Rivularia sp. T60_A2020_040]|nr:hypothetical protein [Rivularia sp. T60_A2020_040]
MSPLVEKILSEIGQLTPFEQLMVMGHLVEQMKNNITKAPTKAKWSDLKGMAPYPLCGEDAQEWVSRTRREGNEHREHLLRANE